MSKGVLEFNGMKQVEYQGQFEEKAMFAKKGGGEWGLGKGSIDWTQFQPRTKLYVEWDNWVAMSATANLPAGGGGFGGKSGYKPPPYHAQTFVSNVCGQAIANGLIKTPSDLPEWAKQATLTIKAVNALLEHSDAPAAPQPVQDVGGEPFNDPIPF
jgi:hypothetical protein